MDTRVVFSREPAAVNNTMPLETLQLWHELLAH